MVTFQLGLEGWGRVVKAEDDRLVFARARSHGRAMCSCGIMKSKLIATQGNKKPLPTKLQRLSCLLCFDMSFMFGLYSGGQLSPIFTLKDSLFILSFQWIVSL